jgi:hypothetical protein
MHVSLKYSPKVYPPAARYPPISGSIFHPTIAAGKYHPNIAQHISFRNKFSSISPKAYPPVGQVSILFRKANIYLYRAAYISTFFRLRHSSTFIAIFVLDQMELSFMGFFISQGDLQYCIW